MSPVLYAGSALAVVLLSYAVFRVVVRREYERFGRLRPLSSLLQYVAILAWVCFGYINIPHGWPAVDVPPAQEAIGWILFVGGWLATLAGIIRLGIRRSHGLQPGSLRQKGMYRLTRNPQAVAFLVAMLGYVVLWPGWRSGGVFAVVLVLTHLMVLSEEEHLERAFDEEYRGYCSRVPRYLGVRRRVT